MFSNPLSLSTPCKTPSSEWLAELFKSGSRDIRWRHWGYLSPTKRNIKIKLWLSLWSESHSSDTQEAKQLVLQHYDDGVNSSIRFLHIKLKIAPNFYQNSIPYRSIFCSFFLEFVPSWFRVSSLLPYSCSTTERLPSALSSAFTCSGPRTWLTQ